MKNQSIPLINHLIALVFVKNIDNSVVNIKKLGQTIIDELKLKTVKEDYYQFKPIGVTYFFILSQSHLIIHTYPENQLIHIDLVACSNIDKKKFKNAIKRFFYGQDQLFVKIKQVNYFEKYA